MFFGKSKNAKKKSAKREKGRAEDIFARTATAPVEPATQLPMHTAPAQEILAAPPHVAPAGAAMIAGGHSIVVDDASDFEGEGGPETIGVAIGSKLSLGPLQSRRSRASLNVAPGQKFEFSVTVDVSAPATGGNNHVFFAGALFFDAAGNIIQWWDPQRAPEPGETKRAIVMTVEAPPSATLARIGLHGSWASDNNPANYVLAFSGASLRQI